MGRVRSQPPLVSLGSHKQAGEHPSPCKGNNRLWGVPSQLRHCDTGHSPALCRQSKPLGFTWPAQLGPLQFPGPGGSILRGLVHSACCLPAPWPLLLATSAAKGRPRTGLTDSERVLAHLSLGSGSPGPTESFVISRGCWPGGVRKRSAVTLCSLFPGKM